MKAPPAIGRLGIVFAVVLLAAAAVTFARADQSLRVAEDAAIVADSEAARSAAATYRANLTIGVVASASESDVAAWRAATAAGAALGRLTTSATEAGADTALLDRLQDSHHRIVAALEDGDGAAADRLVSTETLPVLDELQRSLGEIAATAASRIEAERAGAGNLARISSFVVALIAPALALWAFRRSARRRLERERLAGELGRQRDLADAQQALISGLSHQLRTPLTGIYGFAEAILVDPDPVLVPEAARTILGEANRLRAMVDDILVVNRAAHGDLVFSTETFDLVAEVRAAVEPFVATGGAVDVDCDPVTVVGDRLRTRHVLRNLVDNAIRHGAPPVAVVGRGDGEYRLEVRDAGDGPPAEFRTFAHSGDAALVTGSLGMGLGVCRILCDGMAVDLSVAGTEGGAAVRLAWPAGAILSAGADAVSARPGTLPSPGVSATPERAL